VYIYTYVSICVLDCIHIDVYIYLIGLFFACSLSVNFITASCSQCTFHNEKNVRNIVVSLAKNIFLNMWVFLNMWGNMWRGWWGEIFTCNTLIIQFNTEMLHLCKYQLMPRLLIEERI
jgi:hypothetical protein